MRWLALGVCVALVLGMSSSALARNGQRSLDSRFGHQGRVVDEYPEEAAGPITGLVRERGGRMVVVGYEGSGPLHLWRYSAFGRADRGFPTGPQGPVADVEPEASAGLAGGGIALTGSTNPNSGGEALRGASVARLTGDGAGDRTFGGSGLVSFPQTFPLVQGEAIASDGERLVIGGLARRDDQPVFGLVRLNRDGTLDASFGSGGLVTVAVAGSDDRPSLYGSRDSFAFVDAAATGVRAMRVLPDHRVVAVGTVRDAITHRPVVASVRVLADGRPDPSYGDGSGQSRFTFGREACGPRCTRPLASLAKAAVVQGDKLVIAGVAGAATYEHRDAQFGFARLSADGHLDPTFGRKGIVRSDFGGSTGALSAVPGPGGGIVAGGGIADGFALMRLRASGRLDTSQGTLGRWCTEFPDVGSKEPTEATGLVAQPDGRIVAVGDVQVSDANFVVMARYNRRFAAPIDCLNATLAQNRRSARISGVIAKRSRVSVVVRRRADDTQTPDTRLGTLHFGWQPAGALALRWNLRIHGHRIRPGHDYGLRISTTDRSGHTTVRETSGLDY